MKKAAREVAAFFEKKGKGRERNGVVGPAQTARMARPARGRPDSGQPRGAWPRYSLGSVALAGRTVVEQAVQQLVRTRARAVLAGVLRGGRSL